MNNNHLNYKPNKPIPLKVAREMNETMLDIAQYTNNSSNIFESGMDYLKMTEWFEKLTPEQQDEVDSPAFRNSIGDMVKTIGDTKKNFEETKNNAKDIISQNKSATKVLTEFVLSIDLPIAEIKKLIRHAAEVKDKKALKKFENTYQKIMLNIQDKQVNKDESIEYKKFKKHKKPNEIITFLRMFISLPVAIIASVIVFNVCHFSFEKLDLFLFSWVAYFFQTIITGVFTGISFGYTPFFILNAKDRDLKNPFYILIIAFYAIIFQFFLAIAWLYGFQRDKNLEMNLLLEYDKGLFQFGMFGIILGVVIFFINRDNH